MVPSRILLFPVSSSTLFYECSWLFGGWQKHSIDAHCAYSHRISVWLIYVRLCTLVEANKTTICIIIHMDAATRDAQELHLPTVRGKHTIIVVEHAKYMRMAPIPEHTHTLNLRQQEYREEKKCIWTFDNLQLYGFAFQGQTSIRLRYIGRIVTSKCIQRRSTLYISTIYIDLYANVLYVICTKCVICSFHLATVHRYETVFICSFCRRAHTFGLATDSCRYKAT